MKFFLLFYSILFSININSQNDKTALITYRINFADKVKEDYFSKGKKEIKEKHVESFWDKVYKNSEIVESVLEINKKESIFKLKKSLDKKEKIEINLIKTFAGGNSIYYTSSNNENFVQNCHTLGECFLIEKQKIEWEITQETKKVQGYSCFKATTNREDSGKTFVTVAWFTTELPFNFGPMGYKGLPGLILELDDSAINFTASKVEINPKEKIKIKKPTEGIKVTEKEFLELLKKSAPKGF